MNYFVLLALCCFPFVTSSSFGHSFHVDDSCKEFSSRFCKWYSHASFPNRLMYGVYTPAIAETSVESYSLLLTSNCHPLLTNFLCLAYYPLCQQGLPFTVYPCRSICLDVKDKCFGYFQASGLDWPKALTCEKFPTNATSSCYQPPIPPPVCKTCAIQDKKKSLFNSVCRGEKSLYALIKVLDRKVFHNREAYVVQLLQLYKPRLATGSTASTTVTFITESTTSCPCVTMRTGEVYFVGGMYLPFSGKRLYVLPNDAAIVPWKSNKKFVKKVRACLTEVD